MRKFMALILMAGLAAVCGVPSSAQPPDEKKGDKKGQPGKGGEKGRPQGKGGFGGPGGGMMFTPPQPGTIMPAFLQDMLKLTDAQKKDLAALQKEVDAKLEKLLTDDQKKQLKQFGQGFPGGPGGFPGGPGGFPGGPGGFPGGPPPKKDGGDGPPPKKDKE